MEVKYGIIGVGMMGREHIINIAHLRNEGASVTCVADPHVPSQQQALDLAASFNWPLKVLINISIKSLFSSFTSNHSPITYVNELKLWWSVGRDFAGILKSPRAVGKWAL